MILSSSQCGTNIQIAVEAAQLGFDEILFSHVRFPSPSQMGVLQFHKRQRGKRELLLLPILSSARGQLRPYGLKWRLIRWDTPGARMIPDRPGY
jgi:hypothetical protein